MACSSYSSCTDSYRLEKFFTFLPFYDMLGSSKELEQFMVVHKLLGRVLGVLQEVKETQSVHSALLQSLVSGSAVQGTVEFAHSDRLPLTTVAQFDDFDTLLSDATLQIRLVCSILF